MTRAWEKFAIQGATYARALGNAAQRSGGRIAPQLLDRISAQPRAQSMPGLAEKARAPGALAPTPHQQTLQTALHPVPFAGEEQAGHAPNAQQAFEHVLGQRPAASFGMLGHGGQLENTAPTRSAVLDRFGYPGGAPRGGAATAVVPPAALRAGAPAGIEPSVVRPAAPPGASPNRFPRARFVAEKAGAALPLAAGIAAPLALGAGLLSRKPGIHANLGALHAGQGLDVEQKDTTGELHPDAVAQAGRIAEAFKARGLDPRVMRMAVDAPPGSGKSTLSRAMAQGMGVKHYGLDWMPHARLHAALGGRNIEKMPRAPRAGEILEHYQLLRSYDPEMFDAVVHMQRDPDVIKKQIIGRGQDAYIADFMDYDKSLGVGRLAFDTLAGDPVDLGNGTMMKLRPAEGWGDALDQRLVAAGIDPSGLSRHEKLLSLHAGKKTTGAGWTPYLKSPFSPGEAAMLGASVPLGAMAAHMLTRR